MFKIRSALAGLALVGGLAVAHAQTTQEPHEAHHPDAAPAAAPAMPGMEVDKMMGGNMEQMMRTMMRRMMSGEDMPAVGPPMARRAGMAGLQHIEGQIAFYKAELHITDAQTVLWNTFADTLRAAAKRLQAAYADMLPGDGLPSLPDQLAKRRQLLTAELDTFQTIEPAARALYDALSPEQKKDANELMAEHLRSM
jgi:hypothetical protein